MEGYFNAKEPVPEGWYLIRAQFISQTARAIKIPFRIAVDGAGYNPPKIGILIREDDKVAMAAAVLKRNERPNAVPIEAHIE